MKKFLLLPLIGMLVACSDNPADKPKKVSKDTTLTAEQVTPWPFSFDSITIRCKYSPAVVGEHNSMLYALNGIASSQADSKGFIKVTPESSFWLDNPEIPGTKVSISNIVNSGIEACQ